MANIIDSGIAERIRIIDALHQWMDSQGVPRTEWGPTFAAAAGIEVRRITKDPIGCRLGARILHNFVDLYATNDTEGLTNV